jgi:hypothetical protein
VPNYPGRKQIVVNVPTELKRRAEVVMEIRGQRFSPWFVAQLRQYVQQAEQECGITQAQAAEVNVQIGI